ncbi:hypothetical protein GCM10009679_68190 [Saccharothrix algeriensis]|uniref:Uncharacterized protein n=1 Tax=Catellatospora bangladeshensis TaxID=310355 RepID=A0A8J3JSJ4_9ACTN|nr:hypothetical protein Cba03nite_57090 [Catellatospora bangladeshensis]
MSVLKKRHVLCESEWEPAGGHDSSHRTLLAPGTGLIRSTTRRGGRAQPVYPGVHPPAAGADQLTEPITVLPDLVT